VLGRLRESERYLRPLRNSANGLFARRIRQVEPLGKIRILLADDHRQFRMIVESLLASTCEVVGSVPDGQSLFDAATHLKPDVIVTDISMPILNGIEASKQLSDRAAWRRLFS